MGLWSWQCPHCVYSVRSTGSAKVERLVREHAAGCKGVRRG